VKKFIILFILLAAVCQAAPFLDGTSSLVYSSVHKVFHAAGGAQSKVQGFVFLDNGFTILPDASAVFDTSVPVFGAIDLRETGTMTLANDLMLGSNVTLSSGGGLSGNGNSLILGNNLTLPTTKILHIMSDTKIDGQGHTLTMGELGQIFVDNNVTLTLQNMVFKSGYKTAVFPPVRCAGPGSKCALDNVVIQPTGDISFYQGQLYIHNNVFFTGTSALVYTSSQSSFITSGATLYFDKSTTFSFMPCTMSNQQIIMADVTSKLVLDGASLNVSNTGMRLNNGMLLCDNKVSLDSVSGYSLATLTTATSGYFLGSYSGDGNYMKIRWHPSGKYFACVGGSNNCPIKVYAFNPITNTTTTVCNASFSGYPFALDWSPDGRYVAFCGGQLYIYSFNGTALAQIANPSLTNSANAYNLAWSPDGRYLAVGCNGTNPSLQIFKFNGVTTTGSVTAAITNEVSNITWHPSGAYIAFGYKTSTYNTLIYSFNGTSLSQVSDSGNPGSASYAADFSPDGNYIAIGGDPGSAIIYNALSLSSSICTKAYGAVVRCAKWSPEGKMLAIVGDNNLVRIFMFSGSALLPFIDCVLSPAPTKIMDVAWHQTGKYLAVMGKDATNFYYYIVSPGYVSPTTQALSKSIVFGCKFVSSAWYGHPSDVSKRYNETDYINKLIFDQGGALTVTANGATFGDPASGVVKRLSITFISGTTINCVENGTTTSSAAEVAALTGPASLKVKLLSGARVEIRGQVYDASV